MSQAQGTHLALCAATQRDRMHQLAHYRLQIVASTSSVATAALLGRRCRRTRGCTQRGEARGHQRTATKQQQQLVVRLLRPCVKPARWVAYIGVQLIGDDARSVRFAASGP